MSTPARRDDAGPLSGALEAVARGRPSPAKIDTSVPHSARIWNYWLGGRDHYEVDRVAGDAYEELYPQIRVTARAVRSFLGRAVTMLAGQQKIRQFIDIGTGLPAADNTHEIAQRIAPESRIVYVDNDPLVLAHARALLTSSPEGACDYVEADMREPGKIIAAAERTLDLSKPVALLFFGALGHVVDDTDAEAVLATMMGSLRPGSYLSIADSIAAGSAHQLALENYVATGAAPYRLRPEAQIRRFFRGLTIARPGIVSLDMWRPDPDDARVHVDTLGGVGRK